jgi:hypothetical protein
MDPSAPDTPDTAPDTSSPTPGVDPYQDTEKILALVKKLEQRWGAPRPRRPFLMAAERNIRFLNGDQWLIPAMGGAVGWRPANLKKGTPTPVTNRYAEVSKAFSSMLSRFEPSLKARPATEDPDDVATAEVSERVVEVCDTEVKIVPLRQTLANWVTHTGGAWLEDGYDPSPDHGMVEVPMEACSQCGVQAMPTQEATCAAPGCGGPMAPALDPTGQPVTTPQPRGAMYTEVVNLFEMLFDFTETDPSKHRAFIRKKSIDVDRAKQRWSAFKDRISADSIAGNFLTSDGLAMITPNLDDQGPLRYQQYGTGTVNNRVTETWYWQLPDDTYPDGLLSISLGRSSPISVHAGPLPYYARRADGSKKYFLPQTFFAQEFIPGSAWPRTVMNDVALKQAQRNRWESLIEQAGGKMANHVWLIPTGSNVQHLTGEMGLVINWNAMGTAGHAKPERFQGLPVPQSFYENLDRIDKAIDGLSHVMDVLRGARPPGVTAGVTIQLLKERAESLFGPMFVLWHNAWAERASKVIEIFRLFATEERLTQIMGKNGKWKVSKWSAADLQGNVDIIPEVGVSLPRSTMTDRAEIEQVVAMRAVNVQDPETNYEILKHYGKLSLSPGMKNDEQNAAIENEQFVALAQHPNVAQEPPTSVASMRQFVGTLEASGAPPTAILAQVEATFAQFGIPIPRLRPTIDDNGVHARDQRTFAKTEEFRALPEIVQFFVELHVAAHVFLVGQAQMAAMQTNQGQVATGNMLQRPRPAARPGTPSPMSSSSSGQRMQGDHAEMERKVGTPSG